MESRIRFILRTALALAALSLPSAPPAAAQERVPHNQDRAPGPALSPEEALAAFELPAGFHVELVASEPQIVNPIKMCFDRRGRIWLVESLEYPRTSAGPGRDRVKILEDTDGDGRVDDVKVFAEGLNIPCGIALGNGGAYVTNSPDLLFLEDTDGDDRADRTTVLLTGFGRYDTHELPNTLTWGPDGWLYGLNGVFNPARIEHKGKRFEFTCALWRYHPRTRDFELFAEGTSNPWGVGFDREGAAFVEACVIDHLFHLTETGYYHRQGGAYPPFTWKIESIVEHRNYKAAYCGLDFYDAEAYPEEYRNLVYYGNIHGNCLNADSLTRDGSTYFAERGPILLRTEDVWFMPVDIRLGPDGCFYVLDWYDRYHCYQDARRDPEGIERGKGRLWRIVYGERQPPARFDLDRESPPALLERLGAGNRFWRDQARRKLAEDREPATLEALRAMVLARERPRKARMQALWTLVSADDVNTTPAALQADFHLKLLALADDGLRAWGVRAAGNLRQVDEAVRRRVAELAADSSADVRLQVAIAARKLFDGTRALDLLLEVLARSAGDTLLPRIVWRNLEPLLESHGGELVARLEARGDSALDAADALLGRIVERLLARRNGDAATLVRLVDLLLGDPRKHGAPASLCLEALGRAFASGELDDATASELRESLSAAISRVVEHGSEGPLYLPAVTLAASWGEPRALEACRGLLAGGASLAQKRRALRALAATQDAAILTFAEKTLGAPPPPPPAEHDADDADDGDDGDKGDNDNDEAEGGIEREVLSALGQLESPAVAELVLERFVDLSTELKPQAVDLLSQRLTWARSLLDAVAAKKVPAQHLNVTQVRRLLALGDDELERRVTQTWGTLREERNPQREEAIAGMERVLAGGEGNPWQGKEVFARVCSQCHVLFGDGQAVGPDITVNGRETLDLLLSNLLDPNLVVGKDYYAHTVVTGDGRALTGLLVEDSPQRVTVRVAGGTEEVVARRDILRHSVAPVSLMPEELENTVTEEEFRDLIAFLRFDEAPPAPTATVSETDLPAAERRVTLEQTSYGRATVGVRFPGAEDAVTELFSLRHSNDNRTYLHPLHAPGGATLSGSDAGQVPGLFFAHPDVGGTDFWGEGGWIRSRGLRGARQGSEAVELVAENDWLTSRRGGELVLTEVQRFTVPAPTAADRCHVDIEWRLTPRRDLTLERARLGGLFLRVAAHEAAQEVTPRGRRWVGLSAAFEEGRRGGVALFPHPDNPAYPHRARGLDDGLLGIAVSASEPLRCEAGETLRLRFRLLFHDGSLERDALSEEYRRWIEEE